MKNEKIFVGTIMRCTEYSEVIDFALGDAYLGHADTKSEIYKENAILVKTRNGAYIDIENLTILEAAYLYFENKKCIGYGESYMFKNSHGSYCGNLFVQYDSLKPYIPEDKNNHISLMKLKKSVINQKNN